MTLQKYKEKRDFEKTPEPPGKEEKGKSRVLRFVIQKHEATRLHYDFRLEMEGVMKSWAVPKGPQTDPEIKRLAMETEDHPIEYNDFEGIIPKGQYGGGTVMIWDEGHYLPVGIEKVEESNKAAISMYHKGDLKFVINGKKIKGEYALVKTKREDAENAWLLIKHKDEYASKEDLTKLDKSARTGRSMEEIASGAERKGELWISKDSPSLSDLEEKSLPNKVSPMLAEVKNEPFNDPNYIFEIKWDGYRTLALNDGKEVNLFSRNNISFNELFAPIREALKGYKQKMILDGEVVILDEEGKSNFSLIQNYKRTRKGNIVFYVFDILYFDKYDLTSLPLIERKKILRDVLPKDNEKIRISDYIEEKGMKFYEAAKNNQVEGIVAKEKNSSYLPGKRSSHWLKIKTQLRQEAVIGGFTDPKGGRKHFGSLVLGVFDDEGKFNYIGHSGGGFDEKELKEIKAELDKNVTKDCPFEVEPPTNTPATWVKPEIICEIEFTAWTQEGLMRHPKFLGIREDKSPKEVKLELEKSKTKLSKPEEKTNEEIKKYEGLEVKLSNQDKIYWPDEGYTKGDLIKYYEEIANVMLPYLIDRPESLHRYPEGITGQNRFWQKDIDYAPDWAKTIKIHSDSENKDIDYFLCQNKASLIYMANLGCIEINPWFSTTKNLEKPDFIAIDLDPEDIGFDKVVETAIAVREVLESAEINGFPKTSGATGIHIYIPMGAKYTYDQGKQFAELIATLVNNKLPDITSIVRSPKKRQKRVYVDFLQNRSGQTLAAPYSVRPKPGATVSTPLRWDEINKKLDPSDFTIKTIFKRLDQVGDLWKDVLGPGVDLKKALEKITTLT